MEINPAPQASAPDEPASAATTASSETPNPAASEAASTDANTDDTKKKEDEQGGIKHLFKKALPLLAIFIIILAAGFSGYSLGKSAHSSAKSPASVPTAQADAGTQQASPSPSESPTPAPPDCISGYKPFTNNIFSICYPISMSLQTNDASDSAHKVYTFSDDVEVLTVNPAFKDNLDKYDCASSKEVQVSGYSALRYLIKDKTATGSCAETIASFDTIVSSGDNKPVFLISLAKKTGSYQSDNNSYATLEQTFRINE